MPRVASGALQTLINSEQFDQFDVYTFTLAGGGLLLLTDAPFDISDGGVTKWPRNGPVVLDADAPQRAHWKCGLDVDSWTLNLAPRLVDAISGATFPDKIGSQPMTSAVRAGVLDDADVLIQRAYFPPLTGSQLIPTSGLVPTGFMTIFRGLVGDVHIQVGAITVTIDDYRTLLNIQMPRNVYQAGCRVTLYDQFCKVNAAAYAVPGHVVGLLTRKLFNTSCGAPGGSGDYTLGRVTFTSGSNAGLTRMISGWDGGSLIQLVTPFPYDIALGDTVTQWPGCKKTQTDCTLFANLPNFAGEPNIPPPTTTGV